MVGSQGPPSQGCRLEEEHPEQRGLPEIGVIKGTLRFGGGDGRGERQAGKAALCRGERVCPHLVR